MRWLDTTTDSMDTNLSKLWEIVEDRGAWHAAAHGITKSQKWLSYWTTATTSFCHYLMWCLPVPNRMPIWIWILIQIRNQQFSHLHQSYCRYWWWQKLRKQPPFYFGSIQGAPGSRTKRMHIYRENDFKESAHTITDTGKFESVGWAGRLSPRRDWCCLSSLKAVRPLPLAQGRSVFGPVRPSTDWWGPTHIVRGNLLYSKLADLNTYLL